MRGYQNSLLDPEQCILAIIDHEPQMYFGVSSHCRTAVLNSTTALARAAKVFKVPCILTTVEAKSFSGNMMSKIQQVYPDVVPIDRSFINSWEDANFKNAVVHSGRKKLIISGLWTEACVTFPALSALEDGFDVYVVADACGGASKEAHDMAMERMIQAGVKPLTWQQLMLEWQRDWANKDTYNDVMAIIKEFSGAYGAGVEYAETFIPQ